MEFTDEQITKAKACKTIEEFKDLARAEGLNLSEDEAKQFFNSTRTGALADDDLDVVAGGKKYTQEEAYEKITTESKCPKCGAMGDDLHYGRIWCSGGGTYEDYYVELMCKKCGTDFNSKTYKVKVKY